MSALKGYIFVVRKKIWQRLLSVFASLGIILYSFSPFLVVPVNAQEATESAVLDSIPTSNEPISSPSPSPEPSVEPTPTPTEIQEASSSASVEPSPTPEPLWTQTNGEYTTQTLKLGISYSFPPSEKVSLTFTKLPEGSGTVTVKQITTSTLNADNLNPVTETAYDITSTMTDGSFEYTLTLPTPTTQNVEVKASEDGQTFITLGGVSADDNLLTITGLNHFTIFVVAGTINTDNTVTPFPDESSSDVVINEFVYDDSTEWIELYNRGEVSVDLTGWKLKDANNVSTDDIDLTGTTIPSGSFLVFENSTWLNNTGDTIDLVNNENTTVDQVGYKSAAEGVVVGADDVGSVTSGQSVSRTTDGGSDWVVDSTPSKG